MWQYRDFTLYWSIDWCCSFNQSICVFRVAYHLCTHGAASILLWMQPLSNKSNIRKPQDEKDETSAFWVANERLKEFTWYIRLKYLKISIKNCSLIFCKVTQLPPADTYKGLIWLCFSFYNVFLWSEFRNLVLIMLQLTSISNGQAPGQCNNIITGMNLQIIYANAGAINNPQPAIIGAEYQFYCQSTLNFQVWLNNLFKFFSILVVVCLFTCSRHSRFHWLNTKMLERAEVRTSSPGNNIPWIWPHVIIFIVVFIVLYHEDHEGQG